MFTILLHSSKTMRTPTGAPTPPQTQLLAHKAAQLAAYVQSLSVSELQSAMKLSPALAEKTHKLWQKWGRHSSKLPAIDAFQGDIYSGLQAHTFTPEDRAYAARTLFILSGLYGVLRALDTVHPYRLEMGYKLPHPSFRSLYSFWGSAIAAELPVQRTILNVSVPEYTKAVFPHLPEGTRIITPLFLTHKPGQVEPKTVTVHSKIARGAFAHWVITRRIEDESQLRDFAELGYTYDAHRSTPEQPVYVTQNFQGRGLSVRTRP